MTFRSDHDYCRGYASMSRIDLEELTRVFGRRFKNVHHLVDVLRKCGCDDVTVDNYILHPLQYSSGQGNVGLLSILMACRVHIDRVDNFGNTALMIGVKMKQESSVRFFIDANANLDVKDDRGYTPVHMAVKLGYWNIGRRLINAGADMDAKNFDGDFPLLTAVRTKQDHFVDYLLKSGAKVNETNDQESTPLHEVLRMNGPFSCSSLMNITRMLLQNRAWVNVKTRSGETPLHISVRSNNVDATRMLIKAGAAVNLKDSHGNTPLHLSARDGYEEHARLLLSCGGDPNEKNSDTLTPLDYAVVYDQDGILEMLLEKDAAVARVNARRKTF